MAVAAIAFCEQGRTASLSELAPIMQTTNDVLDSTPGAIYKHNGNASCSTHRACHNGGRNGRLYYAKAKFIPREREGGIARVVPFIAPTGRPAGLAACMAIRLDCHPARKEATNGP